MRKKQELLIQYLIDQSQLMTSDKLAKAIGLSVRTIKTYIAELNAMYPNLISSSNRGYLIQKQKARLLLSHQENLPQDYDERCLYIIKNLLLDKQEDLNLYDLCDELFISYSTLKNYIARMNKSFSSFHITFTSEKDILHMHGMEKDKRKLISHVLNEEASGNFLDYNFLQQSFPEYDIDDVSKQLHSMLFLHHYYINDFSFLNLLQHMLIMVDRIHHGNHIQQDEYAAYQNYHDPLIDELCVCFQQCFHIKFTSGEKAEISLLLQTNTNYNFIEQESELHQLVTNDILILSRNIVANVDEHYSIDLSSNDFFTPFCLHLKNLKLRLRTNSNVKNPMLDSIKNSCPTIYDIATFIAYQLMQEFQTVINEDEIAFLALHVGTEIERQKTMQSKVHAILLCPQYLHISTMLKNQLLLDFKEQLTITSVLSFEHELSDKTYDLLITTIPLSEHITTLYVLLPPLPMKYQKANIFDAIQQIQNYKMGKLLADNLDRYFSEDIFYVFDTTSKEEIMKTLSQSMIASGYVDVDFEDELQRRENASSTAFMNIAIPHPMKMSAFKTTIGVGLSKKGIQWDNQHTVYAVFMIAFQKIDQKHFHELYESIIMLFHNPLIIQELRHCETLDDLKKLLVLHYMSNTKHDL